MWVFLIGKWFKVNLVCSRCHILINFRDWYGIASCLIHHYIGDIQMRQVIIVIIRVIFSIDVKVELLECSVFVAFHSFVLVNSVCKCH